MPEQAFYVSVDAARPLAVLRNGGKRVRFAVVNAINFTAKEIQKAQRRDLGRTFTLRKNEFVQRQIAVIKPFASAPQNRLEARISVGQRPRLLLPGYETGEPRPGFKGRRAAVPVIGSPARPTKSSPVPHSLRVGQLKLRRARPGRRGAAGGGVFRGLQRTFVTDTAVRQRVGSGARSTRTLYVFASGQRLGRVLNWVRRARTVADRVYRPKLELEVRKTFEFQLGLGGS